MLPKPPLQSCFASPIRVGNCGNCWKVHDWRVQVVLRMCVLRKVSIHSVEQQASMSNSVGCVPFTGHLEWGELGGPGVW
jgi:hypothetical protein